MVARFDNMPNSARIQHSAFHRKVKSWLRYAASLYMRVVNVRASSAVGATLEVPWGRAGGR